MKKRKRAEKTERDFRWSISRSAIGQVRFRSACAVVSVIDRAKPQMLWPY